MWQDQRLLDAIRRLPADAFIPATPATGAGLIRRLSRQIRVLLDTNGPAGIRPGRSPRG